VLAFLTPAASKDLANLCANLSILRVYFVFLGPNLEAALQRKSRNEKKRRKNENLGKKRYVL